MDAPPKTPGEAIRQALGERSQGWLAQQIGIKSPTSICLILAGRRRITPKMARRMALALELQADKVAELEREAALSYIKV
jgi:plasmid maintenance system antidote protein VapI